MEDNKRYAVFMAHPSGRGAKRMTDWVSFFAAEAKALELSHKIRGRDFLLRGFRAPLSKADYLYRNGLYQGEQSRDAGSKRLMERLRYVNDVALWALLIIAVPMLSGCFAFRDYPPVNIFALGDAMRARGYMSNPYAVQESVTVQNGNLFPDAAYMPPKNPALGFKTR